MRKYANAAEFRQLRDRPEDRAAGAPCAKGESPAPPASKSRALPGRILSGHGAGLRNWSCHFSGIPASSSARRAARREQSVGCVARIIEDCGEPLANEAIHFVRGEFHRRLFGRPSERATARSITPVARSLHRICFRRAMRGNTFRLSPARHSTRRASGQQSGPMPLQRSRWTPKVGPRSDSPRPWPFSGCTANRRAACCPPAARICSMTRHVFSSGLRSTCFS